MWIFRVFKDFFRYYLVEVNKQNRTKMAENVSLILLFDLFLHLQEHQQKSDIKNDITQILRFKAFFHSPFGTVDKRLQQVKEAHFQVKRNFEKHSNVFGLLLTNLLNFIRCRMRCMCLSEAAVCRCSSKYSCF